MTSPDPFSDDIVDDFVVNAPFVTQPTLPFDGPKVSFRDLQKQISPPPNPNNAYTTQPTQILNTPPAQRFQAPTVQVAGSSPVNSSQSRYNPHNGHTSPSQYSQQTQGRKYTPMAMGMAPRGTYVNVPQIPEASQNPHLPGDDPPVELSSEDELNSTLTRANISRTNFKTSGHSGQPNVIPESPAQGQRQQFDPSRYDFQGYNSPQKRPADDMASAYLSRKRQQIGPRQTGPARAQPVADTKEEVIRTLDDIPDWQTRQHVVNMQAMVPGKPLGYYANMLAKCKNNYADAVARMSDEIEEPATDPAPTSSPPPLPKAIMKRKVEHKGSILSKHSRIPHKPVPSASARDSEPARATQQNDEPEPLHISPAKPRRRLKRKPVNDFILSRTTSSPEPVSKAPSIVDVDEESEDRGPIVIPSDDEGFHSEDDEPRNFDDRLLKFFNNRDAHEIADICEQSIEIANLFVEKRPFRNLDAVRAVTTPEQDEAMAKAKKKSRAKPIGEKVVNKGGEMLVGLEAVDELVKACQERGEMVASGLEKWGVDVVGVTRGGEVSLTSLDALSTSKDSGIGTPDSSASSKAAVPLLKQPETMAKDIVLKDYQVLGLNWLNLLWELKYSCILADDMGLGKTCQVISFLTHLKETGVEGTHLIVVPGSTLENWLREFRRFSPDMSVEPYYGKQEERGTMQIDLETNRSDIDVIVTTYSMLEKELDLKFFRRFGFQVCVCDEAHKLKNSTSKVYKSLMRISAEHRLLLTGTPLQNNLTELISLLAFLMPDLFLQHEDDLSYIFKHRAKTTDSSHTTLLSQKRIERARTMLAPFILRRKKHQVLKHMPAKINRVEYCSLSSAQQSLYDKELEQQRKVLADRAAGIPNKDRASNMMRLRQAAIHPMLLRHYYPDTKLHKMAKDFMKGPDATPDTNIDFVLEDFQAESDLGINKLCVRKYPAALKKHRLKNKEWMESGKVTKLIELLTQFKANGDRTLIFSQFTTVLDILEMVLQEDSTPFYRMDGTTPIAERQDLIDAFYADQTPVFMVSTKSGGAGINLAAANKVIIFDSSFNPQDDIQAENRAHRVGQTREVEVVRLVTRDTIEEQILRLGQSKLALDSMVAGQEEDEKRANEAEEMGMEIVERMLAGEEVEDDKVEDARGGTEKRDRNEEESAQASNGVGDVKDAKDAFAEMLKKKGVSLAE